MSSQCWDGWKVGLPKDGWALWSPATFLLPAVLCSWRRQTSRGRSAGSPPVVGIRAKDRLQVPKVLPLQLTHTLFPTVSKPSTHAPVLPFYIRKACDTSLAVLITSLFRKGLKILGYNPKKEERFTEEQGRFFKTKEVKCPDMRNRFS